jgi:predicted MFS family arabinose efflux permease
MALNTSAIYLGQAVGAASGGAMVAAGMADAPARPADAYAALPLVGVAFMALALGVSVWASRRLQAPNRAVA